MTTFRYMYLDVKSPEFGEIFRGKTLNNDRDRPLVNYVDYGNEVSCEGAGSKLRRNIVVVNYIIN